MCLLPRAVVHRWLYFSLLCWPMARFQAGVLDGGVFFAFLGLSLGSQACDLAWRDLDFGACPVFCVGHVWVVSDGPAVKLESIKAGYSF